MLSVSFREIGDAAEGPLEPSEPGEVSEKGGPHDSFRVKTADGRVFWYRRKALVPFPKAGEP